MQSGELTYTEAVREGMYRPLGAGDVDVAAIVGYLEGHGYGGWYVLEQDTILRDDPAGVYPRNTSPSDSIRTGTAGGRAAGVLPAGASTPVI